MNIPKLKYSIKKAYMEVITSIAFYPVMITLALLAFSWVTIYLDKISVGSTVINMAPFLRIDNPSTATSLLSSLLTGLISLVTFSFSMVMIVLTQIMSSFSPRLLPDLVSRRGNQIVMGIIIGAICFITVVLSNIQTMTSGPKVPLLSVVLSMLLGFASLISFIYFIHKNSSDIQIGNIINGIYRNTRDVLNRELSSNSYYDKWEETEKFFLVKAWNSGYFNSVTEKDFMLKAGKLGLRLRILKTQGMYLLKGDSFLEINKPLDDKIKQLLEENVVIRHQELVGENFLYGFKHLTEIAVKALSPGINDPGTAINAIDYLSDLLCRLQQLTGQKVIKYKNGAACIIYAPVSFESTLYMCLASIRPYSSQDVSVQARLINLISKVSERDEQRKYSTLFQNELNAIKEGSAKDMNSQVDVEYINILLQKVPVMQLS